MTPVTSACRVVSRIRTLTDKLEKEKKHIKPIRFLRKNKIKDIKERLQFNWDKLHEFYPEMCNIWKIETFEDLLEAGWLPNKVRTEVIGSTIYVVGSEEYYAFLKRRGIEF